MYSIDSYPILEASNAWPGRAQYNTNHTSDKNIKNASVSSRCTWQQALQTCHPGLTGALDHWEAPLHQAEQSGDPFLAKDTFPAWSKRIILLSRYSRYSVFHVIVLQGQGFCELDLGLIVSPKASMWPQDWAEISFRSETLWNWFYSEPDRGFSKGRISGSGKSSSIYRVSNVQDFFFLYCIFTAIGFTI